MSVVSRCRLRLLVLGVFCVSVDFLDEYTNVIEFSYSDVGIKKQVTTKLLISEIPIKLALC